MDTSTLRKLMWTIGLLCLMETRLAGLPQDAAKRFTVEDDIGLSHFGGMYPNEVDPIVFSPDGGYFVAETERGLLDSNRPESTLRVYRTEDVKEFLQHSGMTSQPSPVWILSKSTYKDGPIITRVRWLADSSGMAFLAKNTNGNDQLFLVNLATKAVDALTSEDQHITAFGIRDRDHLVYTVLSPKIRERTLAETASFSMVGTGRSLVDLMFPEELQTIRNHDLGELWAVIDGKRFRVNDESSGMALPLYEYGQRALAISPDGRSVATARAVDTIPPEWEVRYPAASSAWRFRAGRQDLTAFDGSDYLSEYVVIDLLAGTVKPVANAPIGESSGWWTAFPPADWSADGKSLVMPNTFLSADMHVSGGEPNRPCLAVADVARGSTHCLERLMSFTENGTQDDYRYITKVRFAPGSSTRIIVDYYRKDFSSRWSITYVRSVNGSWTASSPMNDPAYAAHAIDLSVKQGLNSPPVLVATDNTTGNSRIILDPNPQLKNIDLGEATIFRFKDRNGREWAGGLYRPSGNNPGRYPLVIQTHGFNDKQFDPSGYFPTAFAARELAASGIVVLQLPFCENLETPEEGSCNVASYESAVDHLTSDGLIDPDRIGIVGFSRSCYWVLDALTTSSVHFKAASITDGVNVGYLQYLTRVDYRGNVDARVFDAIVGARPFGEGLPEWFKRSPTFNMHKLKTPLQVVALGRSKLLTMWEPYAALRYLKKPVDLFVLAEGTHVLTSPAERMASQGGTIDWFRFWLQDYEDPDPIKTQQYVRWRELRKLWDADRTVLVQHAK